MKKTLLGLTFALTTSFANAGIINFDINQSFSQGTGGDLSSTIISLGGAGSFTVDPGNSDRYFDFTFNGGGDFSTTNDQLMDYYFLQSYSAGSIIGAASTFGNPADDWDTILVDGETQGVWGSDHSGFLGFRSDNSLFGWIEYEFTRDASVSTMNFLSGAYNDVANADIRIPDAALSVPEPSSIALLAFGLAGLGFSRKKKSV